jgi:hypothetical protein
MTTPEQWGNLTGSTAIDANGDKIGNVGQVYLNDETGEPGWVTVSTGLFGTRESFAPLYNARLSQGEVARPAPGTRTPAPSTPTQARATPAPAPWAVIPPVRPPTMP